MPWPQARRIAVVTNQGEAGRAVYEGILEALRDETLQALDDRYTRLAGLGQTLRATFPGVTVSNAECETFAAAVKSRLLSAVTPRLRQRTAYWWVQASLLASQHDPHAARHAAMARMSTRADEALTDWVVPTPGRPELPPAGARTDSGAAALAEEADTPRSRRDPVATAPVPHPPPARAWRDIEIRLLSDFSVQAVVNGKVQPPQTFAELGFADGRHERPRAAWETLRALAESGGVITSTRTAADWPKLEKRIQEIRTRLRARFTLPGDPVPYRDGAYRARFRIAVSRSYQP